MNRDVARGIAAKAWVHPNNRRRVLDPGVAEAFADILIEELGKAQLSPNSPTVAECRNGIKAAFVADPDFRRTYEANIAEVILADQISTTPGNLFTRSDCNVLADQIIKRIFES